MKFYNRKPQIPGFLTKIRYPHPQYRGLVRMCERCRIKDGLSAAYSSMSYGTCSFCGRVTRLYRYEHSWGKTVARPKDSNRWYWQPGPRIWQKHGTRRKK